MPGDTLLYDYNPVQEKHQGGGTINWSMLFKTAKK